jgi:hypothetical protein
LNDTGDFYRFFDATPQTEFLFECVRKTIEEELPAETDYLRRYDEFKAAVEQIVDMPDQRIDLLFRMLRQNNGRLSQRARQREFEQLTANEADALEAAYTHTFAGDAPP